MIRWFGEAWSTHGVCVDFGRSETPTGEKCIHCTSVVKENDRGVFTACSQRIWGGFDLVVGGSAVRVCCYHLKCWLGLVVGDEMSPVVMERMPGRRDEIYSLLGHVDDEDTPNVGGWRSTVNDQQ